MNAHDPCVWNVSVDGSQLNLVLHTDDVLLGHVKTSAVAEHTKKLDLVHGSIDPLNVTRGKHIEFLGIAIDFGITEKVCMITHVISSIRCAKIFPMS